MQTSLALGELPSRAETPTPSHSWVWLVIAEALLLFSNGADNIPLAAWLAPAFMLRFVRTQSLKIGLPSAYVLLVAAFSFQFRGMVPIRGFAYGIFLAVWGIPLSLPYIIDRLVAHKLVGLRSSLVFPTAWAATEYLMSRGPYATWGSAAYSQYGNLALLQVLSVTGLWGVTFLIGWLAAVCNWLWEEGLDSKRARAGAWLCAATIATVMLFGGARMALFSPSSQTVRVASISKRNLEPEPSDAVLERMFEGKLTSEDAIVIKRWTTARDEDLLSRAEREMQAGAKIVFWGEGNAIMSKEEEPVFVGGGRDMAAKYHVYLGMHWAY